MRLRWDLVRLGPPLLPPSRDWFSLVTSCRGAEACQSSTKQRQVLDPQVVSHSNETASRRGDSFAERPHVVCHHVSHASLCPCRCVLLTKSAVLLLLLLLLLLLHQLPLLITSYLQAWPKEKSGALKQHTRTKKVPSKFSPTLGNYVSVTFSKPKILLNDNTVFEKKLLPFIIFLLTYVIFPMSQ